MIELNLGDCLEYMRTMPDKSVDAIITDLPYGTTACKWDVIIPFAPMWEQVKRIDKGVFVTTASQPFTSKLVMSNLDWFKYEAIYEKNKTPNPMMCHVRLLPVHENIVIFSKNRHTYNPQMNYVGIVDKRKIYHEGKKYSELHGSELKTFSHSKDNGSRYPKSVIFINNADTTESGIHPTQKPVALYEYLIRTYTNEGDTVMDFCMGSGTTMVACVNTGRNGIGIERDAGYFKIAERRIAEAQLQMRLPLHIEGEATL
jgi:site-specific DNA-methyltransferase (adenine-specific)